LDAALNFLRAALVLYGAGFATALAAVLREGTRAARWTPWIASAGALFHTAGMFALGRALGRCPLGTLPEVLAGMSWAAIVIYLFVWWRYRVEVLHIVVLPLALIVLIISKILPDEMIPVEPAMQPALLDIHLGTIIIAVGVLFVTFAASLVYLVVDRALKAKKPARFFRSLPSLEGCDRMGRLSLLWGFPLLTFGIVTGAIVNDAKYGYPWAWQTRETLSILAWLLLAVVLVARLGWGWRGRKPAFITLVGFGLVFLRMFGV
jgi:ABC-type uncharacterized transport system permease subunit